MKKNPPAVNRLPSRSKKSTAPKTTSVNEADEQVIRLPLLPLDRSERSRQTTTLFRIALVFGPSFFLLALTIIVPSVVQGVRALFRPDPIVLPPTNLIPTRFDRLHHAPGFFSSNQIVAYYGHPQARFMGIVGRYPKEVLGPRLRRTARRYDRLNGTAGVVPAFYLIYGTVQPEGRIQLIGDRLLKEYIRYTAKNGYLLILDHQIGRYGPQKALQRLLPFLKYPHVHLAIDPEWRTTRPMEEFGWVSGEELNMLQAMMWTYMFSNNIPGKRMLIVHQFEDKMLVRREKARATFDPVVLIHSISGWGSPSMKYNTWNRGIQATNMPHKAFKLWYDPGYHRPGLHFDNPLMSPQQVLNLRPSPTLIIYQ